MIATTTPRNAITRLRIAQIQKNRLVDMLPYNGRAERRARRRMSLALYPSRVRSNEVLGGHTRAEARLNQEEENNHGTEPYREAKQQ